MAFLTSFFVVHFVAKLCILQQVSEGTNRNMSARNTLVQLLAAYSNPETHNAQRHRQTDGQTDGQQDDASYCVAARSAKKQIAVLLHELIVIICLLLLVCFVIFFL